MSNDIARPSYIDGWVRSMTVPLDMAPAITRDHRWSKSIDVRRPWGPIQAAPRAYPRTPADLRILVEQMRSQPQRFLERLCSIRSDDKHCDELVSRSYWHRNGFAKMKLAEWPGLALRLHVWPQGKDRRGDMNPHGHRWNFASWLLAGEGMIEKHYAEAPADDKKASVYVRGSYGRKDGVDYLKNHRVFYLRMIAEYERTAGVYTCENDVIHTIDPIGSGFMATVVLQSRALRKNTYVYLNPDGDDEKERPRPIGADELRCLLGNLEIAMGASTPR